MERSAACADKSMDPPHDDRAAGKRVRAAKACQRCRVRRIKCDVMAVGQPCSRCSKSDQRDCTLVDTRRGRYSRELLKARPGSARPKSSHGVEDDSGRDISAARNHGNLPDETHNTPPLAVQYNRGAEFAPQSETTGEPASLDDSVQVNGSPYREVSWSAMFNHFLDSRQSERSTAIDKCSITYLGESFPLALVLEDLQEGGGRTRIHHPGPPLEDVETPTSTHDRAHPSHLLPEDMNCLKNKQALEYPDRTLFKSLMETFVDVVFPLYPIVNRNDFIDQYKNDHLPWILLQSVCFAAATFCPITVLHRAGFSGRRQARFYFYRKAKALFDTGYESNKIVILQSVILLTMWGGGPNNYWNFYSWISTGVTIAETLGLHRSMTSTNMASKDRSLLKRLWWTLVLRDAFCASLLGRPLRINMDHGDAEMLAPEDFEQDTRALEAAQHPLAQTFGQYQIEVAKLSLVLHQIVYTRFAPRSKGGSLTCLQETLQRWRDEVGSVLDWDKDPFHNNLLATCLSILYNHHIILASLGSSDQLLVSAGLGLPESAGQRISMAASSIVVKSQSSMIPHETFQGIFLAGVVSYTQMLKPDSTVARLGYSNLNNAQMALHSVLEAWDPVPWVTSLFDRLSSSLQKKQRSAVEARDAVVHIADQSGLYDSGVDSAFHEFDMGYVICSPWQSNPMLNALFEFPQDLSGLDFQVET